MLRVIFKSWWHLDNCINPFLSHDMTATTWLTRHLYFFFNPFYFSIFPLQSARPGVTVPKIQETDVSVVLSTVQPHTVHLPNAGAIQVTTELKGRFLIDFWRYNRYSMKTFCKEGNTVERQIQVLCHKLPHVHNFSLLTLYLYDLGLTPLRSAGVRIKLNSLNWSFLL